MNTIRKTIYYFVLFCLFLTACNTNSKKENYQHELIISDKKIKIPIDSTTYPESGCSFYFQSRDSSEYFTYLNKNFNEIHFYSIDSLKLSFKVKFVVKGPNGIKSNISGFMVKDIDTILITPHGQKKIYISDHYGNIKKVIDYKRYSTDNKKDFNKTMAYISVTRMPLTIINNLFYINTMPVGNWNMIKKDEYSQLSIAFCIDTLAHKISKLNISFPKTAYKYNNWMYSYTYGNGFFVYSFDVDNNIYVTRDFKSFKTYSAQSKYINNMKKMPRNADFTGYLTKTYLNPAYLRIMYDKYRNVFYRFAYPGMKSIDKNVEISVRTYNFKNRFSIIVLDNKFHKICETLLPKDRFNIMDVFISKEGLFISENHPDNPDYNPDYLSFRLLKLIKHEE